MQASWHENNTELLTDERKKNFEHSRASVAESPFLFPAWIGQWLKNLLPAVPTTSNLNYIKLLHLGHTLRVSIIF
jgi:hypothetical protein